MTILQMLQVARAIHKVFNPDKVNYGAYGDTGHHLHFHIVPKYKGGEEWGSTFEMNSGKTILTDAEYEEMAEAIRQALKGSLKQNKIETGSCFIKMRTAAETVRDHPGLQFSFYLETVRLYRCFFFHIYVKEINCRRSVKGEDMKKRRWICMFLLLQVLWCSMTGMAVYGMEPDIPVSAVVSGQAQAVSIRAPSAVLMEASTGKLLFEKDADEKRSPASVTKVMTLLLIFDALKAGKIQMTDQVTTSAYAKSMGGSQVFLEEGEVQTVRNTDQMHCDRFRNDASVAMAEYISGTEEAFVEEMNKRAEGLGMTNTHFSDCCGLTEDPDHLTTARDIALMTRELINCYPEIQ